MLPCAAQCSCLDLNRETDFCLKRRGHYGIRFQACFLMKSSFLVVRACHLFRSPYWTAFFQIFLRVESKEISLNAG
ncbi:hypothetical protein TW83_18525 [Paracoccus sp. S4493]|nr:hypothetical protein TW83_18525 [Paracoccus sp. S4493]